MNTYFLASCQQNLQHSNTYKESYFGTFDAYTAHFVDGLTTKTRQSYKMCEWCT